ncbi:MAG TPA: hypothetical protein DIW36_08490 [Ruminococcaceae bacterium]|nr:hypothetical protein [Oscillospiraceae bacterium]
MDFDKITADIDFISSYIHNIEVNAKVPDLPDDAQKGFGMDIKCTSPTVIDGCKYGNLLMQVEVHVLRSDDDRDTFKIVLEGAFKSSADIPDEKFMEMLNINGGALLLSIARAKLETISALTYAHGKIIIPMINMVQYFEERKKEN